MPHDTIPRANRPTTSYAEHPFRRLEQLGLVGNMVDSLFERAVTSVFLHGLTEDEMQRLERSEWKNVLRRTTVPFLGPAGQHGYLNEGATVEVLEWFAAAPSRGSLLEAGGATSGVPTSVGGGAYVAGSSSSSGLGSDSFEGMLRLMRADQPDSPLAKFLQNSGNNGQFVSANLSTLSSFATPTAGCGRSAAQEGMIDVVNDDAVCGSLLAEVPMLAAIGSANLVGDPNRSQRINWWNQINIQVLGVEGRVRGVGGEQEFLAGGLQGLATTGREWRVHLMVEIRRTPRSQIAVDLFLPIVSKKEEERVAEDSADRPPSRVDDSEVVSPDSFALRILRGDSPSTTARFLGPKKRAVVLGLSTKNGASSTNQTSPPPNVELVPLSVNFRFSDSSSPETALPNLDKTLTLTEDWLPYLGKGRGFLVAALPFRWANPRGQSAPVPVEYRTALENIRGESVFEDEDAEDEAPAGIVQGGHFLPYALLSEDTNVCPCDGAKIFFSGTLYPSGITILPYLTR